MAAHLVRMKSATSLYSLLPIGHVRSGASSPSLLLTRIQGEIDSAVLRRFQRHVHVPLPDEANRRELWQILLTKQAVTLTEEELCVSHMSSQRFGTHSSVCAEHASPNNQRS
jgi:hypothetical protein